VILGWNLISLLSLSHVRCLNLHMHKANIISHQVQWVTLRKMNLNILDGKNNSLFKRGTPKITQNTILITITLKEDKISMHILVQAHMVMARISRIIITSFLMNSLIWQEKYPNGILKQQIVFIEHDLQLIQLITLMAQIYSCISQSMITNSFP